MKNVNMRNKAILCFVLVIAMLMVSIPAMADEPELDNEMIVSATAGMHGYYAYDMETGVETFVPPPSSVEHHEVATPATESAENEGGSSRWVIGDDNRVIVKQVTSEKRTICLVGSRFGANEVGTGTAWLLNKNHLVTAGHVIYSNDAETSNPNGTHYAQHVAVYVGASGGTFSHYRLTKKVYAGADFRKHHGDNTGLSKFDDWGVITLDSPVDNISNFMALAPVNSASEMSGLYTTAGYPVDKNETVHSIWKDYDMYQSSGLIKGDLSRPRFLDVVKTNMDCTKGQSGSPVYKSVNGRYKVSAIVVAEEDLKSLWDDPKENYLLLINDWLYNTLIDRYS